MSITEYVRQKRLEKTTKLLRTEPEWGICDVSEEVGFHNIGYFTRRFREVFACCPREFRETREHSRARWIRVCNNRLGK